MKKVWNITDDPRTTVQTANLMLFGRVVPPGQYVSIPETALVNAHRLNENVKDGLVFVGDQPPAGYLAAKGSKRLALKDGHSRAHGTGLVEHVPDAEVSASVEKAVDAATTPVTDLEEKPWKSRKNRG